MMLNMLVFALFTFWLKLGEGYTYTALDGSWTTGIATVYGTGDGGNCYADTVVTKDFPFGNIVAVGSDLWNNGLGCGACYAVKCIDGSNTDNCATQGCYSTDEVIVEAVDQCPECSNTHLDLSQAAYFTIKDSSCIIDIQFRQVTCPDMGNIRVDIKGGSSAYWIAMYFRQVQGYGAISTAQIRSSGSSTWITCPHTSGQGFYTCSGVQLSLPVSIRLTDSAGNVFTDTDTLTSFSGSHYTNGNFDITGSGTPITSDPVAQTTADPVSSATPEPTTQQGSSGNLILINQEGTQQWWLSFYVSDPACGSISRVQIRDSGSYTTWNTMSTQYGYYYLDNGGSAFTTPIDVRIRIDGQNQVFNNIITSFTANEQYDTGFDPCSGSQTPEPTPRPTDRPVTPQPTDRTVTPEPTPEPSDSSSVTTDPISITTHANSQRWWFTIQINDIDESCGTLTTVLAKGGQFTTYTEMENTGWGTNWYYLPNGGKYIESPVSIQLINSAGTVLTNADVITSMNGDVTYNFQYNFCTTSGSMGSRTIVSDTGTTDSSSSLISSNKVVVTVADSSQLYWVGIYINNINCGSLSGVWFRDSSNYNDKWYEATNLNNYDDTYGNEYELNANTTKSFTLPISIMINNTNDNDIIEYDLINSYDSQQYALESVCNSSNNSSSMSSDDAVMITIVVISILFVCICIGGLLYCKNKNKGYKGDHKMSEMNYYEMNEPMLGKQTNE